MNKNRYLLCFLLCGLMLYYALPRLSFTALGPERLFTWAWLLLAMLTAAGNLSAFLYTPRKRKEKPAQKLPYSNLEARGRG
ncbi:hypothetical protein [Mesobacillus zeae]|uniref:Uncharacterized protein n=1 Tax=Mesobacillus zeae TaxID=1917180 RepID=A0A398B042_9BACI|nr:hypothetical protein [Mesobacillus zeae]RID83152.1 hypothetical protein D1970_16675 [Mesobacillus zeae]